MTEPNRTVLFVCIHNSARSQMAEAFVNAHSRSLRAFSAGLEAGRLNRVVVHVMRELGIDIASNRTKSVADPEVAARAYDYVVTVCDEASAEACPIYPTRGTRLHWGFPDPSAFTGDAASRTERTRQVRDAIRAQVDAWLTSVDR
jgi:arsenate reductase (thioredoxin)